jgi:hypothetical protein
VLLACRRYDSATQTYSLASLSATRATTFLFCALRLPLRLSPWILLRYSLRFWVSSLSLHQLNALLLASLQLLRYLLDSAVCLFEVRFQFINLDLLRFYTLLKFLLFLEALVESIRTAAAKQRDNHHQASNMTEHNPDRVHKVSFTKATVIGFGQIDRQRQS